MQNKKWKKLNAAKNRFVEWLKQNKAECIDVYEGKESDFDYYRCVSGFVSGNLYTVYFTMWEGKIKIDYSDEENRYSDLNIDDFNKLLD